MEMGRQEFVGSLVIGEKIHINLDLSKAYNSISEGKVLSIPIYSLDFFTGCALFFLHLVCFGIGYYIVIWNAISNLGP